MSAGGCGDPSAVTGTAAELFQLAALLIGDQGQAVGLVEQTLSSVEIDPCLDPDAARKLTRQRLLETALVQMRQAEPASFGGAPEASAVDLVCVEDEDLSAAGISHAQLTQWLASEGRQDLRDWLAALPGAQRAIFVQRAVLGQGNAATAQTLQMAIGEGDAKLHKPRWTSQVVGEIYRLALCSLANSLAHSSGVLADASA